jgi:tRNA(Ile)-lysidine synthase
MDVKPISSSAFAAAMARFAPGDQPFIAAAVSGGGDSMALALLLNYWTKERGGRMIALTVDHVLRPDSGEEAERVGDTLRAHDIGHEILTWEGEKPQTHIQERAREKRYELLTAACRRHGCKDLALAHNLEDRAETFWMRLSHGSGLDGLAGMAAARDVDGVRLIRPALSFTRADLRATCMARGVSWIDDPSNENEKFLRVRLRGFENLLAGEGLTPERLARTLDKLAAAREALEFYAARALKECVRMEDGEAALAPSAVRALPREIQSRVLAAALQAVNPQDYPPGSEALEALRASMLDDGFTGRTLAGCEIFPQHGRVRIRREAALNARGRG